MTRPVTIAKTPIQSRSRGAGAGSLAGCEGGAANGRWGAPIAGTAVGSRRRGRRAAGAGGGRPGRGPRRAARLGGAWPRPGLVLFLQPQIGFNGTFFFLN